MSDLRHHGIKGMKWGVRRFQNKDGSLTAAGRKRYGDGESSYDYGKDSGGRKVVRVGKGKKSYEIDDFKDALDKVNKADSLIKTAKKFQEEKDHKAYTDKVKNDLSKMSDKELQQVVNRMNLEERYAQVMKSREKDAGESAAMKWLNIAGTVTTVSASAIAMAIQMKQLMEMSKK